ncbi:MAG: 30S ribosomal protein S8 [Patescibacteria group bacterium]
MAMIHDPISDMITRIRNALAVRAKHVLVPASRMKMGIARVLQEVGYLESIERRTKKVRATEHEYIDLVFAHDADGRPMINDMRLMSKPSRHLYVKARELRPIQSGFGVAVLSTPQGIVSSRTARKEGVGGQVLFEIW